MNNWQSIMDDKLTKFFLSFFSLLLPLHFFHFLRCHLGSSLTVTPCHCFEAHVLEEDSNCHPPLSLLAAFGREPLYFMGFSNLLEMLFLSTLQKKKVRSEDSNAKEKRLFFFFFYGVMVFFPSFLSSQTPAGRGGWPPFLSLVLLEVSSC